MVSEAQFSTNGIAVLKVLGVDKIQNKITMVKNFFAQKNKTKKKTRVSTLIKISG